jgi:hypothetical protein
VLLSHRLGEHDLDHDERERLAAALTVVEEAINVATTAAAAAGGGRG